MESIKYLVWLKHSFDITILYMTVTLRRHMLPWGFCKNDRHENYIILNDFCKMVCIYEKQIKKKMKFYHILFIICI